MLLASVRLICANVRDMNATTRDEGFGTLCSAEYCGGEVKVRDEREVGYSTLAFVGRACHRSPFFALLLSKEAGRAKWGFYKLGGLLPRQFSHRQACTYVDTTQIAYCTAIQQYSYTPILRRQLEGCRFKFRSIKLCVALNSSSNTVDPWRGPISPSVTAPNWVNLNRDAREPQTHCLGSVGFPCTVRL